jgi:hypothetical protein
MKRKQTATQSNELEADKRVAKAVSILLLAWEKSISLSVELEAAIQQLEKCLPAESASCRRFEDSLRRVGRILEEIVSTGNPSRALLTKQRKIRKRNPKTERLQKDYLFLLDEYRAFQKQEIRDYGKMRIGPEDWFDHKLLWSTRAEKLFKRYWLERYASYDPHIALTRILSYAQAIERRNRIN